MGRDEDIWHLLLSENRFFSFTEIKRNLNIHSQQLTTSLRRLERQGLLIKDIQSEGNRPVNKYLGIDPNDPELQLTIYDDHGWLWASVSWTKEDGSATIVSGLDLGEIAKYIEERNGELILKMPEWAEVLAEKGKASYQTVKDGLF